ncbi:zinc finger HIT domain-containing protein [Pyrobaculum neutrophilum]|uniref:HIT-type domain-containing protein n=1 Tax=Pyrobaculum neutrophilum (strain DSM 2338 / JCM 9278 / NBRC 100436 / V24Sta) TaxID=444157 RepID=B1Y9G1_PYRNV|nr:zinc finger HIT domain-containing protein [Pyrobaculum neutrophilum]ACB40390.1 conserved hypothetical protein [Pyrobaculum neutrophilum V24Sta]
MELCQICGFEKAELRCPRCGRRVCRHDWAGDRCAVCDSTLCRLCGRFFAVSTCAICGRPVCDGCSIRVGLGRVCRECAGLLEKLGK